MKKILLSCCALFGCMGFAMAGETQCGVECTSEREGKVLLCAKTSGNTYICENEKWEGKDGARAKFCDDYTKPSEWSVLQTWNRDFNTVAYINNAISREGDGFLVGGKVNANGRIVPDDVCVTCRGGFQYDTEKKECVATKKAVIHPVCDPAHPETCAQNPRVEQLQLNCAALQEEKDMCNVFANDVKAEIGRCRLLSAAKKGKKEMICSPVVCKDNYYLWLDKNGNSQGNCHSLSYMNNFCETGCNNCSADETCEPWIVDIPDYITINGYTLTAEQRKNRAYKECHCVPKDNADEFCKYTFDADVECANGTTLTYNKELSIPKNLFEGEKCKDESNPTFEKWFNAQFENVKKYVLEKCPKAKTKTSVSTISGGSGVNNAQLQSAKDSIDSFFASTESHRSGLKTADGKFNTVRLASDLTAGVVLGTVGGVVSGVVIKKKQVEKGFEALHCAVGGQTVADWGDTFEVGLRK